MARPRTFHEAHAAQAIRRGGWQHVPAYPCPDLGGLVLWPEMPWNHRADELEVDETRTAMLADPDIDVEIRCRLRFTTGNVRLGVPYQRVDGRPLHHVWPVRLFAGLGWRIPLPAVVTRFGDPTDFLNDSQHVGIDLAGTTIHELASAGIGWRGWQGTRYARSDYSRPFAESDATTAGRIPLLAGTPRPEELLAGHIPRAMLLSAPASRRWRWPARGADGMRPDHPVEYGDRLTLRPEVADELLAELDDTPSRAVVECLRDYGAHLNDRPSLDPQASGNLRLPMDPRVPELNVPGLRYSSFVIRRQPAPQEARQ